MTNPLSHRMLQAADILEEVSRLYEAMVPDKYPWSASELRREAHHVAEEE